MRELSPLEKEILNICLKLESKEGNNVYGIPFLKVISEFFTTHKIKLRYNEAKRNIEVKTERENSLEYKNKGLIFLLALSNIIHYLSTNKQVVVLSEMNQKLGLSTNYNNIESTSATLDLNLITYVRKEDIDYLFGLFKSTYIFSEDLKVYIQKGFKTKDDLKYRRQIRVAYLSSVIALVIGILSFWQRCETSKSNINADRIYINIPNQTGDRVLDKRTDTLSLSDTFMQQ